MNTIFAILLILIFVLSLFLASVNNTIEGYDPSIPYDPSKPYSNKVIEYANVVNSKIPTENSKLATYAPKKYDAKTYDNPATIQPGTTLGPFVPIKNDKQQDSSGNWSKTLGNVIYNEPGSLRFGSSNYVPTYEDSIFLSSVTGLKYNQPMYVESTQDIGFCEFNKNSMDKIEEQCSKLDKNVCSSTGCCVLLGGSKCVAGNYNGPYIKSNYGDTLIKNKDHYYHQGKCYGNCTNNDYKKNDSKNTCKPPAISNLSTGVTPYYSTPSSTSPMTTSPMATSPSATTNIGINSGLNYMSEVSNQINKKQIQDFENAIINKYKEVYLHMNNSLPTNNNVI